MSRKEMEYVIIAEVSGRGQAELLASYLEAQGICVELMQDSVWRSAYVLPFSVVRVLVRKGQASRAMDLMKAFEAAAETEEDAGA